MNQADTSAPRENSEGRRVCGFIPMSPSVIKKWKRPPRGSRPQCTARERHGYVSTRGVPGTLTRLRTESKTLQRIRTDQGSSSEGISCHLLHSERTGAFADSLASDSRVVLEKELRKAQDECDFENRWSGSLFRLWCALIFMGGPYDAMMRASIRGRNGQGVLRVLSSVLDQPALPDASHGASTIADAMRHERSVRR